MSNDEWKELSEKLHYGLALAEQRMLEKKSTAERNCDSGYTDGEIKAIPARRLLRKAKQRKMK